MTGPGLSNTPAIHFRFCPRCGAEGPGIDGARSLRCGHCGFLYFFNSAAAAGAFVLYEGSLILCVRAKEPARGMLDLPGGFIEFDETVEEGLQREIQEELNIATTDFRYLASAPNDYLYAEVPYKTTDLFFVCEAPDIRDIRPADDVGDFLLVAPRDLDPHRLAFSSARTAFEALLGWLERP
jgi:ADP-ribose pyrophosphatase YjhB (NUDIX family)